MVNREKLITNYIDGYNNFDINQMIADFDKNIVFENISNGETNMLITGLALFKEQAEQAKKYFSSRKQTLLSYIHHKEETEVVLNYRAIAAIDLPNGLKKDAELQLQGKSIFKFYDNKIIRLTDIS